MNAWRTDGRNRLASKASALFAMRGLAVLATAAGIRVITELLEPQTFGEFRLVLGVATFVSATGLLPLARFAARHLHDAELVGEARQFVGTARRSVLRVGLVGVAAVAIASFVAVFGTGDWQFVVLGVAAGVVAIAQGRSSLELLLLATRGQVIQSGAYELALSLVVPVAVVLAAVTFGQLVAPLALAQGAAVAILVAVATSRYRAAGGGSVSAWLRSSRSFALPLAAVGALAWVLNVGDRYLLASMMTAADVGRYAAAYGIAASGLAVVGGVVPTLMMRPLFRAAVGIDSARRSGVAMKTILAQSFVVLVAVAAIFLVAPLLTQLLLAPDFRVDAVAIMRWVAVGQGLIVIAQALDLDSYSRSRTRPIALSYAVAAAANIALNLVLIPTVGVRGAAIATALSGALYLAMMIVQLRPFSHAGR